MQESHGPELERGHPWCVEAQASEGIASALLGGFGEVP